MTSDHTDFAGNVLIATENAVGILATGEGTTITVTEVTSGQDINQSATFYMAAFSQDSDGITTGAVCTGSGTISNSISASPFTLWVLELELFSLDKMNLKLTTVGLLKSTLLVQYLEELLQ